MKVKFSESKSTAMLTEGKVYDVINSMRSSEGGFWGEVMSEIGIVILVKIEGNIACAFGKWEVVIED